MRKWVGWQQRARRALAGLALVAGLAAGESAEAADLWGLVIGVDDYQHVNKLEGAVNDAKDIAQALHKAGARDVKLLTDAAASRDAIEAAWKDLTARAQPGDTLVLSFAGHGATAPNQSGQIQQFVVLPGFEFKGAGTYERILDAEFGDMLRAVPKLNVVFVVDSCHAGTMTRGYSKSRFKVRSISGPALEDDRLAAKARALPAGDTAGGVVLPNVVHLGAVRSQELDPEILINNTPRGALSFAISRALEGAADRNKDGKLQPEELETYVRSVIDGQTDGQQHPVVEVRRDWSLPLVRDSQTPSPQPAPQADFKPKLISLAILNAGPAGPAELVKGLKGVQLAPDDSAELIWDAGRGEISSHLGDVVAYGSSGSETRAFQRLSAPAAAADPQADLPRVQRVIDKMVLVDVIKQAASKDALLMGLTPDDKVHAAGTQVAFTVQGQAYSYLTLVNLASDGTVNFLYPQQGDPLQIPLAKPYRLDLKVQPPFGADHLVAIASSEPLTTLHQALATLDNSPAAAQLAEALGKGLDGKTFQIGIHPSFSAP